MNSKLHIEPELLKRLIDSRDIWYIRAIALRETFTSGNRQLANEIMDMSKVEILDLLQEWAVHQYNIP